MTSVVTEQFTLRFGWGDRFTFGNYFSGVNSAAVECLRLAALGQGEQFVFLHGTAGSGKSHLLQAACQVAAERGKPVAYLPLPELRDFGDEVLTGLEQLALVCVDDLQVIAGQPVWEQALFHLFNRVIDSGCVLLLAADQAPAGMALQLADLRSRLGWGPVFRLQELDDGDKIAALRLRAQARGFDLPQEVAEFLLRRCPRDTASLFVLLDKLDQASLAQHRKLTIPFVRSLL